MNEFMSSGSMFSVMVPVDFTDKSVHALSAAASLVRERKGIIQLVHVVDSDPEIIDHSIIEAKEKLLAFAQKHQEELQVALIPNIVTGNIFTTIGDTASRLGVQLIVMGVHGLHGIQFIIGSFAVRVILGSLVPVLLVNDAFNIKAFKNIVLPIDSSIKMNYMLDKTIKMARQYSSTIHLFAEISNMSFFQRRLISFRLQKAAKKIRKSGIPCQVITIDGVASDFAESVTQYAGNINAQMIALSMQTRNGSKDYLVGKTATRLVEKSRIPLYIVNPQRQ